MTDAAENLTEPQKPQRRKKRAKRKAAVVPFKAPDEFAGMNALECCTDCNFEKCVISGINVCGHPNKAGQVPAQDQAAQARFARAKKVLAHQKIELREAS